MAKRALLIGAAVAVCLPLAVLAWPASAEETTCTTTVGALTVDNLRVPDGATCTLDGTDIGGTITVERGATLIADVIAVEGNIQSEGAARVDVAGSMVGGSIQLAGGTQSRIEYTRITGDLQVDDLTGPFAAVDNVIGGNLQPFDNQGGVEVRGNRIDGNLQCKGNDPAPSGGGNVVEGNAEDQCANLLTTDPDGGSPRARFCDTENHTFEASIDRLAVAGIAEGDADGCFNPDGPVNRGQMAAFLQRGYELAAGTATFCDTAGTTHAEAIGAIAAAAIAQGGADGCFRPADPVTRGQMATFLARAERLGAPTAAGFCDTAGSVHETAIRAIAQAGITQGDAQGCFRPNAPVTRGQMAALLVRALDL